MHQCLAGEPPASVSRLVLTASGGPFRGRRPRNWPRSHLSGIVTSHVGHRPQDHDRLGDHVQQRSGDRRSPSPLRCSLRQDRRPRASPVDPALGGRVRRWLLEGSHGRTRHEDPDPVRTDGARAVAHSGQPVRSRRSPAHLRAPGSRDLSGDRHRICGRSRRRVVACSDECGRRGGRGVVSPGDSGFSGYPRSCRAPSRWWSGARCAPSTTSSKSTARRGPWRRLSSLEHVDTAPPQVIFRDARWNRRTIAILLFVTAHEAGHFIAAKATGMKATEFFFGFGPRLWSTKKGETEYASRPSP